METTNITISVKLSKEYSSHLYDSFPHYHVAVDNKLWGQYESLAKANIELFNITLALSVDKGYVDTFYFSKKVKEKITKTLSLLKEIKIDEREYESSELIITCSMLLNKKEL